MDNQKLVGHWHNAVGALADTVFRHQSNQPERRRQLAENALTNMSNELANKRGIGQLDTPSRDQVKLELAQAFDAKDKIVASRTHYLEKERVCHIPEPRPGSFK